MCDVGVLNFRHTQSNKWATMLSLQAMLVVTLILLVLESTMLNQTIMMDNLGCNQKTNRLKYLE